MYVRDNVRSLRFLPLLVAFALLAACSPAATPAATSAPTQPQATTAPLATAAATSAPVATQVVADTGAVYHAYPAEQCELIRSTVEEALKKSTTAAEAPFEDLLTGESGTGCLIQVTGTGAEFPGFLEMASLLKTAFEQAGWSEDPAFLADSPTGTAFAMRNGSTLALVNVSWQPGPAVSCPADQPISACNVPPEQQIYTVSINIAEK